MLNYLPIFIAFITGERIGVLSFVPHSIEVPHYLLSVCDVSLD